MLRGHADGRPRCREGLLRRHLRLGVRRARARCRAIRPASTSWHGWTATTWPGWAPSRPRAAARCRRPGTPMSPSTAPTRPPPAPGPPAAPCWSEPFDAPPAGRMAVIADPAGAALSVWEAGDRAGAARVNEPSAWAMSLLTTPDPDGARAFYAELFGWEAEEFGPRLAVPAAPATSAASPHQPVPRDVVAAMASRRVSARGLERGLLDRRCRRRRGGRARAGRQRRRRALRGGATSAARSSPHPTERRSRSASFSSAAEPGQRRVRRRQLTGRAGGRRESDSHQHSAAVTAETTITDGHAPITRPSRCESAKATSPVAVSVAVTARAVAARPHGDAGQPARGQDDPAEGARPGAPPRRRSRRSARRRRSGRSARGPAGRRGRGALS